MAILNNLFKKKETPESSNFMEELEQLVSFIQEKCKNNGLSKSLQTRVENMLSGDEMYRKDNLPGLFLSFEQYVLTIGILKAVELDSFRLFIKRKYPFLSESRSFRLIYLNEQTRKYILSSMFLMIILERAKMLPNSSHNQFVGKSYDLLIMGVGDIFEYNRKITTSMQEVLQSLSQEIHDTLLDKTDLTLVANMYNDAYEELAYNFQMLEGFTSVLSLFPEKLLNEKQINLLNNEQVKGLLFEKVGSLHYANQLLKIEVKERKKAQKLLQKREIRINRLNEKL